MERALVNIDLKQLEELLEVLEQRDVSEFEFEDEKVRVHFKRGQLPVAVPVLAPPAPQAQVTAPPPGAAIASAGAAPAQPDEDFVFVTTPFVGTFYRAPSPEAPPFVDVPGSVRRGQVLCIVEAMKLMNELESELAGTIVECLVENGHPVEFGQKLFKIKKT
jgi:acetyl-CoA carboxylase biotin carboxyl carrier protein